MKLDKQDRAVLQLALDALSKDSPARQTIADMVKASAVPEAPKLTQEVMLERVHALRDFDKWDWFDNEGAPLRLLGVELSQTRGVLSGFIAYTYGNATEVFNVDLATFIQTCEPKAKQEATKDE